MFTLKSNLLTANPHLCFQLMLTKQHYTANLLMPVYLSRTSLPLVALMPFLVTPFQIYSLLIPNCLPLLIYTRCHALGNLTEKCAVLESSM